MPLVVPNVSNSDKADWAAKLLGKKLSESTSDNVSFAKKDLPPAHRVVKPGEAVSMDYRPERLNVHVSDDGTVTNVAFG